MKPGPQNVSLDVWRPDGPGRTVGFTDFFFGADVTDGEVDEMIAFALQTGARGHGARRGGPARHGLRRGRDRTADAGERAAGRALPVAGAGRRCAPGRSRACPCRSASTARTSRSRRAGCCATRRRPRPPASTPACARTTSRRGASARASRASPGRSSAPRCRRRRCRGASSTPRPALPPGDRRPGGGDAVRAVPRPPVGRARHGRVLQRAHHRRAVAAEARPGRTAARVRRRHARAVRRRGGRPRRADPRRPREAVDAARPSRRRWSAPRSPPRRRAGAAAGPTGWRRSTSRASASSR